jgi:hypothetical protein
MTEHTGRPYEVVNSVNQVPRRRLQREKWRDDASEIAILAADEISGGRAVKDENNAPHEGKTSFPLLAARCELPKKIWAVETSVSPAGAMVILDSSVAAKLFTPY